MLNFLTRLLSPPEITIKKGALTRLRFLSGGTRALIICGQQSLEKAGHLTKIKSLLTAAKLETSVYHNMENEPNTTSIASCTQAMQTFQPDWLIACGGGAVMDTAKAAWIFYEHPDIDWKAIEKPFSVPSLRNKAKLVAIPTTSGSGSEGSLVAVINDETSGKKCPIVSSELLPDLCILDPELTLTLPLTVTAYTALDALTHAFESFCSTRHNALTDIYATAAGKIIIDNLESCLQSPLTIEFREKLLYAAMLAGQAQGVTSVGAVHAFSHVLGAEFNIPHGLGNALFLPTIANLNAQTSERPLQFIQHIGLNSLSEFTEWVNTILQLAGLPQHWHYLIDDAKSIDSQQLAQKIKTDICMRTNPKDISVDELAAILEEN